MAHPVFSGSVPKRTNGDRVKIVADGASTEGVASVNGAQLHYITRGNGPHVLLCIPALLGTPELHYSHQLDHFGREDSGFTVVSFEPRGFGTSQKFPRSKEGVESFLADAKDGYELMKSLFLHPFSVIGWCNGGIASLFLASLCPEAVRKLVVFATRSYITELELETMESMRDVSTWNKKLTPTIELYGGPEAVSRIWSDWMDTLHEIHTKNNGDYCTTVLSKVSCPTLIVHGAKDGTYPMFHAEYLRDHVKGSRLVVMGQGNHFLHITHHQEFNQSMEEFLIELQL